MAGNIAANQFEKCLLWSFTILIQAYNVLRSQIPTGKLTFEKLAEPFPVHPLHNQFMVLHT
jgi:hypothetical protein